MRELFHDPPNAKLHFACRMHRHALDYQNVYHYLVFYCMYCFYATLKSILIKLYEHFDIVKSKCENIIFEH